MADFKIGEVEYKSGKLSAMVQFFCTKRLGPALGILQSVIASGIDPGSQAALMQSISAIPDHDCLFIFDACLGQVQRKRGQVWEAIWNLQAHMPQHDDIDMTTMLAVTIHVLKASLGNSSVTPALNS